MAGSLTDVRAQVSRACTRLIRTPGFTIPALLGLALAIGANVSVFLLINDYILTPPAVQRPSELVTIFTTDVAAPGPLEVSRLNVEDLKQTNQAFSGVIAYRSVPVAIGLGERPTRSDAALVSANYFTSLGVSPLIGRTFNDEEDRHPGGDAVVVLGEDYWRTYLNADPTLVGHRLTVNGFPFTVIGIIPKNFSGINLRDRTVLWLPISMYAQAETDVGWYTARRAIFLNVIGRLAPGVTLERARQEVRGIGDRLAADYPTDNKGRRLDVRPMLQSRLDTDGRNGLVNALTIVSTATFMLLLLAYANVSLQLVARVVARRKTTAIQQAVGASMGRINTEWAIEISVLLVVALLLGLLLSSVFKDLVVALMPVPSRLAPSLDQRVLVFSFGLMLVSVVVCTAILALQTRRLGVVSALKEVTGLAGRAQSGFGLKRVLVFVEIVICTVPLVSAGLLVRSLLNMWNVDLGFKSEKVLMVAIDLGAAKYDDRRGEEFYERLLDAARAMPGVTDAVLVRHRPVTVGGVRRTVFREGVLQDAAGGVLTRTNVVGEGYFKMMGVTIIGREFSRTDASGSPQVVVVSAKMASQFWPGRNAVGQRIRLFGDKEYREVIGVAANTKINSVTEPDTALLYLPLRQFYAPVVSLFVHTTAAPPSYVASVQQTIARIDPAVFGYDVTTLDEHVARSVSEPSKIGTLLGILGFLGLVTAGAGVYGLASAMLAYRHREIGIRLALGASRGQIVTLVIKDVLVAFALACVVGSLASWLATSMVKGLLFGVNTSDPATYFAVLGILGATCVIASGIPAWRACHIDPARTLAPQS